MGGAGRARVGDAVRRKRIRLDRGGALERGQLGGELGVVSSLGGKQVRIRDAFGTKEAAQGSALLLAMRRLPGRRDALHEQLDTIPRAWWWKIMPLDDAGAESRSIFSERVSETEESAERGGRAAGAGWYLYVYGPGCARAFGRLPA